METKLQQTNQNNTMPAGIFEGVEAFWYAGEKWIIQNGMKMRFSDAPLKLRDMIANQFLKDKPSQEILRKQGITAFSSAFEMWYRCVIGALDSTPDFINGKFTADSFNYACDDHECQFRGKLCGRASGLNSTDVQTLAALKRGDNFRQTAASLYVSEPGLKSRVTKLREKLEARNTAALTARAAEIGI
ncbi:helix-turn-helix transcriptional regulator [Mangrovibacterium sp.]|uniref:helix-turn-helix transcriptional regulator n=1 Tax=Mangrovibacterium sp. TaxID=1961364 RepID=UPI0035659CB4